MKICTCGQDNVQSFQVLNSHPGITVTLKLHFVCAGSHLATTWSCHASVPLTSSCMMWRASRFTALSASTTASSGPALTRSLPESQRDRWENTTLAQSEGLISCLIGYVSRDNFRPVSSTGRLPLNNCNCHVSCASGKEILIRFYGLEM